MSEFALILGIFLILLSLFVVLVERKFLAYAQRRMGPTLMGRNGAFQLALDLIKLLTKETFLIPKPSSVLAPIFLSLFYASQLMFSQNFIFGPSLFVFDNVDSLILHHLILILLSNIFFIVVGLLSQSRYAIMGTVRALVHIISLDIFITIIYTLLIFSTQSAQFHDFAIMQNIYWFIFLFAPAGSGFVIVLLLESKRAPFDHAETESEVVAGYAVEYSGTMLLMFYLTEYLHLIISSVHFVLFFTGGWMCLKIFFFLPSIFLIPHESNYYFDFFFNYIRV